MCNLCPICNTTLACITPAKIHIQGSYRRGQEVIRFCRAQWTWDKEKARPTTLLDFDPEVHQLRKAVLSALGVESRERKMGRSPVSSNER